MGADPNSNWNWFSSDEAKGGGSSLAVALLILMSILAALTAIFGPRPDVSVIVLAICVSGVAITGALSRRVNGPPP